MPGRGFFGALSGDEIVVSPPSPNVETLKTYIPRRFHASTENILPAGDDHAP